MGFGGIEGVGRAGGGGGEVIGGLVAKLDLDEKEDIRETGEIVPVPIVAWGSDVADENDEEGEGDVPAAVRRALLTTGSTDGSTEAWRSCSVSMVTVRVCPDEIRLECRESEVLRGIRVGGGSPRSDMAAIVASCFERMS